MSDGGYTILVREDDPQDRAALADCLTDSDYEVTFTPGMAEARAAISDRPVDLLLMAVPPGSAGALTDARLLVEEASARGIPVVGLARLPELSQVAAALGRRGVDWLPKPADALVLDARVAAYRRQGQLSGEVARQGQRLDELGRSWEALVKAVIPIGVSLLGSRDFLRMTETILVEAQRLCNADGGTIYLRTDDDMLRFAIMRNDSLGIAKGGVCGVDVPFAPLPLRDPTTGAPNMRNVATCVANTARGVNIADAYEADGFEFSGTREFDRQSGYRSCSFLTVPLENHDGRVIGVLQLVNALDPKTGTVVPFARHLEPVVEALCALAAAALEVYTREDNLRREIRELHIRIDEVKRQREVRDITESDYFRELQQQARELKGT